MNVGMRDDKRADPEADSVGLAERGDNAQINQRLDDGAGARRAEGDIAAAPAMITGRSDLDAQGAAFLLQESDEEIGQRAVPGPELLRIDLRPDIEDRLG